VLLVLELAEEARKAGKWTTAKTLLEEAKDMAPLVVDTWREEVELTKASEASTEAWEDLLDDMERNYDEHPNILEDIASIRREHLLPTLSDEEMIRALESEIRSMARQNGSEGDLVSEAVASLAKILVERESGEALRSLYKGSLRKYGEDLELFGKLMGSYQKYGSRLPDVAPHIPKDLERYFKREVETGTKEYFRGDMELDIQRRVAQAYRKAGQTEEADEITEDIAKRRERLERSAL
jgi:tetratricopeptide (TPR) repeat protein